MDGCTHLTKAMILGGSDNFVWKNRLLLIECGATSAAIVYTERQRDVLGITKDQSTYRLIDA